MIDIWMEETGHEHKASPARRGEARTVRGHLWSDWTDDGCAASEPYRGGVVRWRPTPEQERYVTAGEVELLHRLLAACEGCVQGWRPLVGLATTDEARVRCVACIRLVDACAIELAQLLATDDEMTDVSVPRTRSRMSRFEDGDRAMWERLVTDAEACVERACRVYEHTRLRTASHEVRELADRHLTHMQGVLEVVRELRTAARAAAERALHSSPATGLLACDSEALVIP